jgi:dephospho-CoA kinase
LLEQKKSKEEYQAKRRMVRDTLDRQVKEQREQRQLSQQQNMNLDQIMLTKANREIEKEKREKQELRRKIEL